MKYTLFGHIFFLILILMTGIFYLERILYADSAFQFFKIINFERFNVEAGRYSAALAQIWLLPAIKLGMELRSLVLIFSVSYILIYYLVYLICVYAFKDLSAGILLLFLMVLGIRSSFFHPVTETHQGLIYSGLFYAWLFNSYPMPGTLLRRSINGLGGLLIIALCYFSHPVTFILLVYILGYFLIDSYKWKDTGIYLILILIILIYLLKFFLTADDGYEGKYFSVIRDGFSLLSDFFAYDSFEFFIKNIGRLYYFHAFIAVLVVIHYIRSSMYLKLGYYILAVLAFFSLTVITYHSGDSPMSMEKNFMPLSLLICLPFIKEVLPGSGKYRILKFLFLIIVLGVSLYNIYHESATYKSRIAYLGRMMEYSEKVPGRKFIIEKKNADMNKLMIPWALSVETLLYSSLGSPDHSKTFFMAEDARTLHYDRDDPELFLCTNFWPYWSVRELNGKYFRPGEGQYRLISEPIPGH